jgi:hypothetical protein
VQTPRRGGEIHIQISIATLAGLDDNPAIIPGYGTVLADIARQVALDPQTKPDWRYSVTDRDGDLLHHGRTKRRPTPTDRAFVKARDRYCRISGCHRRATDSDDDHGREHARGGQPDPENLRELCRLHHRMRHLYGYTLRRIKGATYVMIAPNGRIHITNGKADLSIGAEDDEPVPPPPQDEYDEYDDLVHLFGTLTWEQYINQATRPVREAIHEAQEEQAHRQLQHRKTQQQADRATTRQRDAAQRDTDLQALGQLRRQAQQHQEDKRQAQRGQGEPA